MKKYMLFLVSILILASCSSGGGESSSGVISGNKPSKEPIKPSNPVQPPSNNPSKPSTGTADLGKIKYVSYLPEKLDYDTPEVPTVSVTGEGYIIGIFDSDFSTNEDSLKRKYERQGIELETLGNPGYQSKHGENVLDLLADGLKDNKIMAASMAILKNGTKTLKINLSDYQTVLSKMKDNDKDGEKRLKVFNQSWGASLNANEEHIFNNRSELKERIVMSFAEEKLGYKQEILNSGNKVLDFYENAVKNENALFVWANGNYDSNNQTITKGGLQAAAPIIRSGLEKGWISVVGVDGTNQNNDYPKHLAHAGSVSRWSISASGEGKLLDAGIGSSYAAPRVSNAAVKVADKFKWMTNNDVRLTLFTTTNKIGVGDGLEEEKRYVQLPSYTHGWGVLNEARALKGPGAFWRVILDADIGNNLDSSDFGTYFNAKIPEGTKSYFENNIIGDSGLKKSGKGTLVLTGENSFAGKTKITDGAVEIYKSHTSGIDVEKDGILVLHNDAVVGYKKAEVEGWSDTYNTVLNGGEVDLTGKTAYVGEYKNNGGKLTVKEGANLNVLKKASLDGMSLNIISDEYSSEVGKKSEVIVAKEIEGNVADVKINGMRKASVEKEDNKLVAKVSRLNAVDYLGEVGESSKETVKKIENRLKELDEKAELSDLTVEEIDLGKSIVNMSVSNLKSSTEIVSGEIYASAQAINLLQAQETNRILSNHLNQLEDLEGTDFRTQWWMSVLNSNGKIGKSGYANAKTKIYGTHFGFDTILEDNDILGVSLSYSKGKGNFENSAGKYSSDSVGASLYRKRYFGDNFYVMGKIGASYFDTTVERTLLNRTGGTVKGEIKHKDYMFSSYLELGKKFKYVTPYISYSYDYFNRGSFNESNLASWGIVSGKKAYENQNISLGLYSEYYITNTFKVTGNITHSLNIGSRELSFKGRFANSPTEYSFKGIPQLKNVTWIGVGLYKDFLQKELQVGANLDMKLGEGKNQSILPSLTLNYRF